MLCRVKFPVCFEIIQNKHIPCDHNVEFFNVNALALELDI